MSRARDLADLVDANGDVKASALDNAEAFPVGTLMVFQQTSAPTGWTKQTTHNDKAFRCVSGSCSSGGTTAFSTAMATPSVSGSVGINGTPDSGNLAVSVSGNISNTTLSNNQISSHSHTERRISGSDGNYSGYYGAQYASDGQNLQNAVNSGMGSAGGGGGGGSHNHAHTLSGTMTGAPGLGNLTGTLSSSTASINVQYVDVIIAAKD